MIETIIDCDDWLEAVSDAELIAVRCWEKVRAAGVLGDGAAAILLADDDRVAALNQQFRGKAGPTNVLSFPGAGDTHLGDIALAFETCQSEAQDKGVALSDHVAHLIVHGLLHLAGHDHHEEHEASIMEKLETEILSGMGIADPYSEDQPHGDAA